MNGKLLSQLPDFLCENELVERLKILPNYNTNIANETMPTRLLALSELYDIYIPYFTKFVFRLSLRNSIVEFIFI